MKLKKSKKQSGIMDLGVIPSVLSSINRYLWFVDGQVFAISQSFPVRTDEVLAIIGDRRGHIVVEQCRVKCRIFEKELAHE